METKLENVPERKYFIIHVFVYILIFFCAKSIGYAYNYNEANN